MATRPESMMIQGGPKEYKQRAIQEARSAQDAIDKWFAKNDSAQSGRYQFKELIGKGSYGRVYKSTAKETGQTVAIKVLTPDDSDLNIPAEARDTNLQDALKEINILERLKQSGATNVNQFIEAFTVHSQLWLISEYCSGGSLSTLKRAAGGKLKEGFIRAIARELALGLASVHRAGIVHRDIKCANVMISESGGVQIIDFGVSAVLMSNMEEDKRKTIIGTPHWMAPELQQAPDKEVPHGSEVDVWAYGITLYECAKGFPPNATVTQQNRLRNLLRHQPPRLTEDEFSAELRDLVSFVLNPDPKARPTMQQVCEHPYLEGSEEDYPTASLMSLVETYYNWERSGGQRASLWFPGGANQANYHQKPEQDEWVFSTTAAFDRMHDEDEDISFGLSSSPPRESDELDEDQPLDGGTLRPGTGAANSKNASAQNDAEQDAQARRGEKHLERLFDQSAAPYDINGKANDLPLRPDNSGSSFHTQELSLTPNDSGTPNINLVAIDNKKASKRQTMGWKWEDNKPKLENFPDMSAKRPSITAHADFSLGEPVTAKPSNNRDTLDIDVLMGVGPARTSVRKSMRNSNRHTFDMDSFMNEGAPPPAVPPIPSDLPSHTQRPSFQDPRKTLDIDELLGGGMPEMPGPQQLYGAFSFQPSAGTQQTFQEISPYQHVAQQDHQSTDFAKVQSQPQFQPQYGVDHSHQSAADPSRSEAFNIAAISNDDLNRMMSEEYDYPSGGEAGLMTDDETSSLASHDFSSLKNSGSHSRNQSGSIGGGLASSPPTSPSGTMIREHHHYNNQQPQHAQLLHHHRHHPHLHPGFGGGDLPPVPQFPPPVNSAALVDGADRALVVAEMRRLLATLGAVQDVALVYLDEKDRRAGINGHAAAAAATAAAAASVASSVAATAADDADTESVQDSVTEGDEHDGVNPDDEWLEMRQR